MKTFTSFFICVLISMSAFAQDYALKQLENSPRHHQWVTLESQGRELHNFVVYPQVDEDVPVVIVIHENRGLNDWARSFADQLAGKGYIAVAPDLLSNTQDGIEKTSDFATSDAARSAIYELDPDGVTQDLKTVLNYAQNMDGGNGKVAVAGFCWGGSQSFRFATNAGDTIEAAFVFYGTAPEDQEAINRIEVPVYGFYGGDDQRVNSTISRTEEMMIIAGNTYEYEIYEGAGHAFMRSGDDPNGEQPNIEARNNSWNRLVKLLSNL
ncbi:dienelactone hydrolase family protein [Aliifodinibius sp. S!AR15-10]|uniref:dienelactone hydrolase family protein n=1 Tax=Aliifodinibius sp. S!AR15-10 TaxID=2950437 RepID=UPI00285B1723|nr:dienelactone hydrolase family protein [Aliifodinibius sp. S!AR15-10]MDR8390144.1 dienelactone hydrolase family protein [Aliifodinibius sp. S!AR15-10]